MLAFLKLAWPYIVAAIIGAAAAWIVKSNIDGVRLAVEQKGRSDDKAAYAANLKSVSDAAAKQLQDEIVKGQAMQGKIAALDQNLQAERENHAKDNAANNAAIAAGKRRLRVPIIAAAGTACGNGTPASASAGSVGNDSPAYAELSPTFGLALYGLADDADDDAAKVTYLQGYVKSLQENGYVTAPADPASTAVAVPQN